MTKRLTFALPALLAFLLGCTTTGDSTLLRFVAARAGDAARIAVIADLQANPSHRLPIQAGLVALDALIQSGKYSSAEFKAVLQQLPIKEFRGTQGALVLEGSLLVFDLVTMFAYDITTVPAVQEVMLSVREGISAGLGVPVAATAQVASRAGPPDKLIPIRVIKL